MNNLERSRAGNEPHSRVESWNQPSRDWKRGVFRNLPWTRLECEENLKVRSLIRSCWLVPELCMGSTTGRKEWLSCDHASGSIMRPKQNLYLIVLHMSLRKTLEAKKLIFFVCQRAEYAILELKHSLCSLCWGDIKVYCSKFQCPMTSLHRVSLRTKRNNSFTSASRIPPRPRQK